MGYLKKALEEAAHNLAAKAQVEANYSNMTASDIVKHIMGTYGPWQSDVTLSNEPYHEEGYAGTIIDSTATVINDETKLLPARSEVKQ